MIIPQRKIRKFATGGLADSLYFTPVQTYLPKTSSLLDPNLFQPPIPRQLEAPVLDKELFKKGYNNDRAANQARYDELVRKWDNIDPKDIRYGNRQMKLDFAEAQTLGRRLSADAEQNKDQFDKIETDMGTRKSAGEMVSQDGNFVVQDKNGDFKQVNWLEGVLGHKTGEHHILSGSEYVGERKINPRLANVNTYNGTLARMTGGSPQDTIINDIAAQLGHEESDTISKSLSRLNSQDLGRIITNTSKGFREKTNINQLNEILTTAWSSMPPDVQNMLEVRATQEVSPYLKDGKTPKDAAEFQREVKQEARANIARKVLAKYVHESKIPRDESYSEANAGPSTELNQFDLSKNGQGDTVYLREGLGSIGDPGKTGISTQTRGNLITFDAVDENKDGSKKMGSEHPYVRDMIKTQGQFNNGIPVGDFGEAAETIILDQNSAIDTVMPYRTIDGRDVTMNASNTANYAAINSAYQKAEADWKQQNPNAGIDEENAFRSRFYTDHDIKSIATLVSVVIMGIKNKDYQESQQITWKGKEGEAGVNAPLKSKPTARDMSIEVSPIIFEQVPENTQAYKDFATAYFRTKHKGDYTTAELNSEVKTFMDSDEWKKYAADHQVVRTIVKVPYRNQAITSTKLAPLMHTGHTFGAKSLRDYRVNNVQVQGKSNYSPETIAAYKAQLEEEANAKAITEAKAAKLKKEEGGLIPSQIKVFELELTPLSIHDLY